MPQATIEKSGQGVTTANLKLDTFPMATQARFKSVMVQYGRLLNVGDSLTGTQWVRLIRAKWARNPIVDGACAVILEVMGGGE